MTDTCWYLLDLLLAEKLRLNAFKSVLQEIAMLELTTIYKKHGWFILFGVFFVFYQFYIHYNDCFLKSRAIIDANAC